VRLSLISGWSIASGLFAYMAFATSPLWVSPAVLFAGAVLLMAVYG
jgi:hypothetical protein